MPIRAAYFSKVFRFNFKARTSRGPMKDKTSWFVKLYEEDNAAVAGWGECGPLPGLSVESPGEIEPVLNKLVSDINTGTYQIQDLTALPPLVPAGFSSILFALETAALDLANGGKRVLFDTGFMRGEPIAINGLIWMGDMDFLMEQINKKVAEGFRCLKLKVGGQDFDRECDILQYIRKKYFRENITLRLDANGGFKEDDVLYKLEELARYGVHSIEQPLKPGREATGELCRKSPIPVAFDEELIGIDGESNKRALLQQLKPQYIILKPSLHGGLSGCREWVSLAEQLNIGWWITSALESSIGLNAICQFTSTYKTTIPQGLGTGSIYEDNIPSPLRVRDGQIFYDEQGSWTSDIFM